MLAVNQYECSYIEAREREVKKILDAYRALPESRSGEFEQLFLRNLIVVLDASFMHRSRTLELKDGNPANEVRMLAQSILSSACVLQADKSIKYRPENSVLGIEIGHKIELGLDDFERLSKAYFAEITKKFST